ncbi:MAG: hypothetical protein OXU67_00005 [Chloroflexota bacterium]|nr:hypothetical protein [Chloroflexota bacterium]
METLKQKQAKLHQLVDSLPLECLDAAAALLASLRGDTLVSFIHGQPIVRLGGLWAQQGVAITETDIAEARRELWGRIGEDEV